MFLAAQLRPHIRKRQIISFSAIADEVVLSGHVKQLFVHKLSAVKDEVATLRPRDAISFLFFYPEIQTIIALSHSGAWLIEPHKATSYRPEYES